MLHENYEINKPHQIFNETFLKVKTETKSTKTGPVKNIIIKY